jgi:hypothetical protein
MENQNSLSAYLVSEKTPIFLENTLLSNSNFQTVASGDQYEQKTSDVCIFLSDNILGEKKSSESTASTTQSEVLTKIRNCAIVASRFKFYLR